MSHALANIAFELAGAIGLGVIAGCLAANASRITRALRGDKHS